jgi:rod shape-determining protein MreD
MRWLYLVVSILVLSSIQFIAMAHLHVAPDLLLIFAVFLALNVQREQALMGAWLGGLFSEVSGGQAGHTHIGVLALLFTFFAWLLSKRKFDLYIEHWLTRTMVVAVVSLVCTLGGVATIYVETKSIGWESWSKVVLGVICTTLFSIPLIPMFARIRKIYYERRP